MATPVEALRLEAARDTALALVDVIVVLLRQEEIPVAIIEFQTILFDALARYEADRASLN